jgi:hypothetical protein
MKFEIGDLVHVKGLWNMSGVILADDTAWHMIKGHYEVKRCVVAEEDLTLLQAKALTKEQISWCVPRGQER